MKKKIIISLLFIVAVSSCISTKLTIKNINDTVVAPAITADNTFKIIKFSADKKYGYHQNYPVNVGFTKEKEGSLNELRFLNALKGPNGENITYERLGSCCPFPTKKTEIGSGVLDQYQIIWEGQKTVVILYLNRYEKGEIMVPLGFTLKNKH